MILKSLSATNFKNIAHTRLDFSANVNCLLGDNGMGKSNLLDAIYFLSFCKSYTGAPDALMLMRTGPHTEDFAMLQGDYLRRDMPETINIAIQPGKRKSLKRSGKEYKKLSEHIGLFPLVMVSPADMDLVNGSGEERRRLMDMVISQTDPQYLDALIKYGRLLEQRNRLLRDGIEDANLYLSIELTMDGAARQICDTRRRWVAQLSDIFKRYYGMIAGEAEIPSLSYSSHLAEPGISLMNLMNERRTRDAALKYTTAGPHRDDIEMMLSGMPLRRTASQGQAKTYTIALRLAQYEFLKQATGITPLLLLDDIFDKLDASRVERIMEVVSSDEIGQIFITDTHRKHLDEILARSAGDYALFTVDHGCFTPVPL
ncbi:MAG: DNA replication and repair protein RecF [Bacteroidales bacterium]|nr:DNA replication and repair protein RecF [Bacteroidales bacterium]